MKVGFAHVDQESLPSPTPPADRAATAPGGQVGKKQPQGFQRGRGREHGIALVERHVFGHIAAPDVRSRRVPL
eukprot:9020277-Alexandrium_andersonii.AAC.1